MDSIFEDLNDIGYNGREPKNKDYNEVNACPCLRDDSHTVSMEISAAFVFSSNTLFLLERDI